MTKYTLDRIEENQYVFLKHPDEIDQLIIPVTDVEVNVSEGDIVLIAQTDAGYQIEIQKEETELTRNDVESLLEKLKNKK